LRELAKVSFASFLLFAHGRGAFRRWLGLVPGGPAGITDAGYNPDAGYSPDAGYNPGRDRSVAGIADPGEVVPPGPASPMPATSPGAFE